MNIIVDRPKLVRVVLLFLNNNFGNLTPKTTEKYPNSVFYVNSNNEITMEYNQENYRVYINYDHIWSKIESLFHLNYGDIQSFIKVWLEDTYKLEGVTPTVRFTRSIWRLEDTYKLEGVTPSIFYSNREVRWMRIKTLD
jgi:hypothetical protein